MITDHRTIVRKYLFGWFPIDCVSIVPYDLIGAMMQDDSLSNLKVLRAIRLLRLGEAAADHPPRPIVPPVRGDATSVNYVRTGAEQVGRHPVPRALDGVSVLSDRRDGGEGNKLGHRVLRRLRGGCPRHRQRVALRRVGVLGGGDAVHARDTEAVIPATNAERLYAVAGTFIGGAVYAYLLGSVRSIITNLDEGSNTFYRQMDELNRFMKEKATPLELRVKLRDYFRFKKLAARVVEWSGVMHLMSDALRLDVAEEVFGGWIRAMPIFRDCPKRLPAMLSGAPLEFSAEPAREPDGQPRSA